SSLNPVVRKGREDVDLKAFVGQCGRCIVVHRVQAYVLYLSAWKPSEYADETAEADRRASNLDSVQSILTLCQLYDLHLFIRPNGEITCRPRDCPPFKNAAISSQVY
ncbi:MAG: hypothetical protein V2B20_19435, partial [Pseudomonadota bacterium]